MKPFIVFLCLLFASFAWGVRNLNATPEMAPGRGQMQESNTTTSREKPQNYFKKVDVTIVYSWNKAEPDTLNNVDCRLVRTNGVVTQLRIISEDSTDEISVAKGQTTYEIRDSKTGKLLAAGP